MINPTKTQRTHRNNTMKHASATKKTQSLKQQTLGASPAVSSSSGEQASLNEDLTEEQKAERKVLKDKAWKAKNQCRYYEK
jgi:hypothetical protein